MNRRLKFLRTRLGRLIRDIERKIDGDEGLQETFAVALGRAAQIRGQKQRQRGWKLYSWHAPETECIGKGKARAPYEFGVKVSLTTTNRRCKGGQFILHSKALPGSPYDGHTLKDVIGETEALTGRAIERAYVDAGYRGHDVPRPGRVFRSGQKRGVHGQIKKELRRRSAIEAVIGHCKTDGHLGRNFLKGPLRRPYQRRHERRRLQHAPHPQVVEAFIVRNHRRHSDDDNPAIGAQSGFLTADCVVVSDIPQMTSKFAGVVLPIHRHGNSVPFVALRCGDFGGLIKFGTPFGKVFHHLDAPLPSFSPLR